MISGLAGRRSILTWVVPLAIVGLVAVVWFLGPGTPSEGADSRSAGSTSDTSRTSEPSRAPDTSRTPDSDLSRIAESALPREARTTLDLIRAGGPFPYAKDGTTFGNRERLLLQQRRGYYREYTVKTPGESDRGPRRIVSGRDGDHYWTSDHYESFRQIEEGR